jgi:hypothetical protein
LNHPLITFNFVGRPSSSKDAGYQQGKGLLKIASRSYNDDLICDRLMVKENFSTKEI